MIIEITDKFRVCKIYSKNEKVEADNVTTFDVESIPVIEENSAVYFNPKTNQFRQIPIEPQKEIPEHIQVRMEAMQKKATALKWLADNDWKVNKRTLGEWAEDDERWIAYLSEREKARADIDEANAVLEQA